MILIYNSTYNKYTALRNFEHKPYKLNFEIQKILIKDEFNKAFEY
jgi:hypothetical protein